MKKNVIFVTFLVWVSTLCACAEKNVTFEEPAITVNKKGEISQTIVESFDKDYYSTSELQTEFEKAIADYDRSIEKNGEVVLREVRQQDGKVFVTLDFSSYKAANSFQGQDIFYGLINEAYDYGYSLDVSLKSVDDGSIIEKNELMNMSKNHIFVVSDSGIVKTDYKIKYISADVEYIDEKTVRISSDSDGLAYIVMK